MDVICDQSMPDLEVVRVYLETRSNSCFTLLYNRYAAKVYGKCLAILREDAQAQDATQEVFTKIFLNLPRFGEKAQFSTWVYSITYNYCIDFIRRNKKHGELFSDDLEHAPDVPDDVPDEELLQMEVRALRKVLEALPVGDRIILLMKYQDDMQIKEIAALTSKSESAVKMQILRAKEKAKKLREEQGMESE